MAQKVHETCPKCSRNVLPHDGRIELPKLGWLSFWRYECPTCGWIWANALQRIHNDKLLDKALKVGGGWYS